MKILQYQETEMGDPIRIAIKKKFGINCELVREPARMDGGGVVIIAPWRTLYSYVRPSNGERLWLIEVEMFTPPDAQWWRSWVIDEEPTEEQICQIISANAQQGSVL